MSGSPLAVELMPYIVSLLSLTFAMLISILAWVGLRVMRSQDELSKAVAGIDHTLREIETDIRAEIGQIHTRLALIEARLRGRREEEM